MEDHQDLLEKFNELKLQLATSSHHATADNTPVNTDSEASADERKVQEIKVFTRDEVYGSKIARSRKVLSESLSKEFWGDHFQSEELISVDYVTWFNCWAVENENGNIGMNAGSERSSSNGTNMRTTVRHALLLTDFALYLLEVRLETPISTFPTHNQNHETPISRFTSPKKHHRKMRSRSFPIYNESKISAVQVVCRLDPLEIAEVSLPYNTIQMPNGDEFAQRSADLVFASKTGCHYWLQFNSNQARGCVVDVLHEWFENVSQGSELFVSQVMSSDLLQTVAEEPSKEDTVPKKMNSFSSFFEHPSNNQHHKEKCSIM